MDFGYCNILGHRMLLSISRFYYSDQKMVHECLGDQNYVLPSVELHLQSTGAQTEACESQILVSMPLEMLKFSKIAPVQEMLFLGLSYLKIIYVQTTVCPIGKLRRLQSIFRRCPNKISEVYVLVNVKF